MAISNNILHRYNMLCIDDLVTINSRLVGIIIDINDNTYVVKDSEGVTNTYNRQQLELSTFSEIQQCLQLLLKGGA